MRNLTNTSGSAEPVVDEVADLLDEDTVEVQIVSRPDGYYWVAADGLQEVGPFDSHELAMADVESVGEEAPEPGESLQEAEDEIGIADWIDPDTGEPAEGQSSPRLYSE